MKSCPRLILLVVAVALASCAPKTPTKGSDSLPNIGTAIGRARILSDLTQDDAKFVIKHGAGAVKDRGYHISDLMDRQRGEHSAAEAALAGATKDRDSLVRQVIDGTHERIRINADWQRKFEIDHAANEWTGWHLRRWILIAKLVIAAVGIGWLVWGVWSALHPEMWLAKFFFHNAPLAGPFMKYAGQSVQPT